jgi:hypothetical protein
MWDHRVRKVQEGFKDYKDHWEDSVLRVMMEVKVIRVKLVIPQLQGEPVLRDIRDIQDVRVLLVIQQ